MNYVDLVKYALINNGRIVTKEISFLKKCRSIRFECSEGHMWEVVTHKALSGVWCPECNGTKRQRNTIEMMKEIAENRGGRCFSIKYINSETKLEWECSEGHRWLATPHSIKSKESWCQQCKVNGQKNTIEDMQRLASKKGGKCLSKDYVLNNVNLLWECADGHQWENQPANITMGQWCPTCSKNEEKLTIEEMRELAETKGGKCLSENYIDIKTKLLWECINGHQWMGLPAAIKHHDSWCPVCAGNIKKTLEEIQQIAVSNGGKLLSKRYENNRQKLKWKCSEGHVFFKTFNHVVNRKQWCPTCFKISNIKKVA